MPYILYIQHQVITVMGIICKCNIKRKRSITTVYIQQENMNSAPMHLFHSQRPFSSPSYYPPDQVLSLHYS